MQKHQLHTYWTRKYKKKLLWSCYIFMALHELFETSWVCKKREDPPFPIRRIREPLSVFTVQFSQKLRFAHTFMTKR